ncbi:MAG: glutamate-1-semialdehyde 2,1-aminomutase [Methanobacteriota archaeon]
MEARQPARPKAPRSERLFARAQRSLAGGVDSPVRAFREVGGTPRFIVSGLGPRMRDADGRTYLDYCLSWGALLLGHALPAVVEAVRAAVTDGTSFGAATEAEVELAEGVRRLVPSVELLRFVTSGTESTMSALRVARGATGRDKIVKFEGCYHGHVDALLARAGSGVAAAGLPGSAGVPRGTVRDTLLARFNDLASVEALFRRHGRSIAAVIVEPVAGNMGVVPPATGFLRGLREITEDYGSLLVFDEVITGFRVAPGGAQELYRVRPDLTCLGKVLGHGLPVAAYGGRREVMEHVAPLGPVYQAGTLAGNPLAMAAGLAVLGALKPPLYERLDRLSDRLARGFSDAAEDSRIALRIERVGSMLGLFFTPGPIRDYADARAADPSAYVRLFWSFVRSGVYFPPAPFETVFVSAAHTHADIDRTIAAAGRAFDSWGASA